MQQIRRREACTHTGRDSAVMIGCGLGDSVLERARTSAAQSATVRPGWGVEPP